MSVEVIKFGDTVKGSTEGIIKGILETCIRVTSQAKSLASSFAKGYQTGQLLNSIMYKTSERKGGNDGGAEIQTEPKKQQGIDFLQTGARQLHPICKELTKIPNPLVDKFQEEKAAWGFYYDTLNMIEKFIKDRDPFALALQQKARNLLDGCKIAY